MELASELAAALGQHFQKQSSVEIGGSADVSLEMVRKDVEAALVALNETLSILTQVEETVEQARRQGQADEKVAVLFMLCLSQLWKQHWTRITFLYHLMSIMADICVIVSNLLNKTSNLYTDKPFVS